MFILDLGPDIYLSRIPDPGSRILDPRSNNSNKWVEEKKFVILTFCYPNFLIIDTNFIKLLIRYFTFEQVQKTIWANSQRIQKEKPIPDPEVKKSRSRIRNTGLNFKKLAL